MKASILGSCRSKALLLTLSLVTPAAMASGAKQPAPPTEGIPRSMAALGDSMTAGALASYKRQNAWLPWVQASALVKILSYAITSDYHKIESRHLSWSTGLDSGANVISHARRLIELHGGNAANIKVLNAAVSGSIAHDVLLDQWPRVKDWSRRELGQESPDYVTLMIGPNDVCADSPEQMTSVKDYHDNMSAIIGDVASPRTKTKLLVNFLPNIEALRRVAAKASLDMAGMGTCEDMWKLTNLCPTLTTIEDPAARALIAQRVIDYNTVIADIVSRTQAGLDDPDRIRLVRQTYDISFTPNHLSVDCFHPGPAGQNMLSRGTWEQTWWGGLHDERRDEVLRAKAKNAAFCRKGPNRGSGAPRCED